MLKSNGIHAYLTKAALYTNHYIAGLKPGKQGAKLTTDELARVHTAKSACSRSSHAGTTPRAKTTCAATLRDILQLEVLAELNLVVPFGVGVALLVS